MEAPSALKSRTWSGQAETHNFNRVLPSIVRDEVASQVDSWHKALLWELQSMADNTSPDGSPARKHTLPVDISRVQPSRWGSSIQSLRGV